MSRLIEGLESIKVLFDTKAKQSENAGYWKEFAGIIADAISTITEKTQRIENMETMIEDMEERIAIMSEHGLWIPVEERLPKIKERKEYFGTKCIVCDERKQVFTLRYCKRIVRKKEVYRWMRDDMSIYHGEVVYWMPLPEPPKEGETE